MSTLLKEQVPSANRVTELCLEKFKTIPKNGKPIRFKEWTVLSCILLYDRNKDYLEVVSLGTGTKCCGSTLLVNDGCTLNDSHAEIMCRRGFLRYLYDQILITISKSSTSIFIFNDISKQFTIKKDISFHFFTTHAPCGDASIFPSQNHSLYNDDGSTSKKIKLENVEISDNFTGAKIISSDQEIGDKMDQQCGAIRTKPGRGDPTLSVSCSDKLAKWCLVGIQGALLSLLIREPIYLDSFTFSNTIYCDVDALKRALWGRFIRGNEYECFHNGLYKLRTPKIQKSNQTIFEFERNSKGLPAPASIVWCKVRQRPHEVAVSGKCLGVTKKSLNTSHAQLKICKRQLFILYLSVRKLMDSNFYDKNITYGFMKKSSTEYMEAWNKAKDLYFQCWTIKPKKLNEFLID